VIAVPPTGLELFVVSVPAVDALLELKTAAEDVTTQKNLPVKLLVLTPTVLETVTFVSPAESAAIVAVAGIAVGG
jgi:hypothetical protein